MKRTIWIFTALLLALSLPSQAQKAPKKSKEEEALEKEWTKKLKELKPLDYKQMVEEKESLNTKVLDLEASNVSLKEQNEKKEAELARLKKELEDYNSGMAPAGTHDHHGTASAAKSPDLSVKKSQVQGVVYKVQIGSFKNKDLSKYFDNNPNFSGEVDSDGTKKYTLGAFEDYWEADRFKKAMREMGVKDAWIVPYKDGKRVNIKDVLEGTL